MVTIRSQYHGGKEAVGEGQRILRWLRVASVAVMLAGWQLAPASIPVPESSVQRVWVGVEDAERLVLVDLVEQKVVEEHEMPDGPHNVTVAADGTAAAALYRGTDLAIVRDGELTFVELGATPHDVKASGDLFIVANEVGERLDLVTLDGNHLGSIPLRGQPHDTAIAPDGLTAWVTLNHTDQLAVIDLEAHEIIDYVPTGQAPHNILFGPDGRFWVTDWRGPVHAFSAEGELLETLPVGEEAHHLAFTPDGGEVWVTDHRTREAIVIDTDRYEVLARLEIPGNPHHINITADGALAAVADHTNGTLVVFDVATRERVATIEVGAGPHGVWAVPAGTARKD
jgi:YVTN family beta-propeller protein